MRSLSQVLAEQGFNTRLSKKRAVVRSEPSIGLSTIQRTTKIAIIQSTLRMRRTCCCQKTFMKWMVVRWKRNTQLISIQSNQMQTRLFSIKLREPKMMMRKLSIRNSAKIYHKLNRSQTDLAWTQLIIKSKNMSTTYLRTKD